MKQAIILIGKPGSGKSSIAQFLEERNGAAVSGTGNLLRAAAAEKNERAKKIQTNLGEGTIVPTEIVVSVLNQALLRIDKHIILFDGFPRIKEQIGTFFNLIEKTKIKLGAVVLLKISDETVLKRLSGRRVCKECKEIYNIYFNPPPADNKCKCGGTVEMREDDNPDIVRKRLDAYEKNTQPIIDYFREKYSSVFFEVPAENDIETTAAQIRNRIKFLED